MYKRKWTVVKDFQSLESTLGDKKFIMTWDDSSKKFVVKLNNSKVAEASSKRDIYQLLGDFVKRIA